jgi:23S rRNA (guanosine2251-2'-O)-methyltransferase
VKARNLVNPPRPAAAIRERRIYGVHPVLEWLRAAPTEVQTVYYHPHSDRLAPVVRAAAAAGVAVQAADAQRLTSLVGHARHQGVAATCAPFPYADLSAALRSNPQLLVIADRIQDPHNLGALIRTAEAVAAGAVVIPTDGAAPVTAAVEMAAAGATALVPVCRVVNMARSLRLLRKQGYWIVGLVPRSGADLYRFDVPERVAMVVGGEAGMRPLVRAQCDFLVSIPMLGKIESLNASVATAIAVYELRRRWGAP